jgi:hypothetical protein
VPLRKTGAAAPVVTLKAISIEPSVCSSAASWSSSCAASEADPTEANAAADTAESYVHDQFCRRV